jgi:RNA polymerase sigma factor (TIGR02999 family)
MLEAVADPSGNNQVDGSIPALIAAAEGGDRAARDALFESLYAELHRMARQELARQGGTASIGATTLLHEAYLDMAGSAGPIFPDRARFMAYAARVMRGLIIDHARERQAIKRGGGFEFTSLETDVADNLADYEQLAAIGSALDSLALAEPALAEVIDLRFFCGFSIPEIAALSSTSERTVHRRWEKARIYVRRYLRPETEPQR